jgi:hypothetical protein
MMEKSKEKLQLNLVFHSALSNFAGMIRQERIIAKLHDKEQHNNKNIDIS